MHDAPHPHAGQTVLINVHPLIPIYDAVTREFMSGPLEFRVLDWADRTLGHDPLSQTTIHTPTEALYIDRVFRTIRLDDVEFVPDTETVYGHVGGLAHIIHASEIEE